MSNKGLTVDVLRSAKYGDSTNGGVSSKFNEVVMHQAQFSTQEQLEWLRSFYRSQIGCVCCPKSATELIRLANVQGLYDAADHVQRKYDAGERLPEKLMEW